MILIVCVDEKNGMLFNNRRQSKDRNLIEHILKKIDSKKLWITEFSRDLFLIKPCNNIIIDNNLVEKIEKDDYCFIENIDINTIIDKVDKIIVYNWNRHYPADTYLDVSLCNWIKESETNILGFSHDKITEIIYVKEKN